MSRDPFESWFDSQKDIWPSQWHAAQAAWKAAQEQPAAPAFQTIGRTCVMCGHMNVWDVKQAAPRAPLSRDAIVDIAALQKWYVEDLSVVADVVAIARAIESAHGISKGEA
jgi:hypothetical protein